MSRANVYCRQTAAPIIHQQCISSSSNVNNKHWCYSQSDKKENADYADETR